MMLWYIELKKNHESKCVDILCDECRKKAPDLQTPLTEREKAKGYHYIIRPYAGAPRACMDCERTPDTQQQGAA